MIGNRKDMVRTRSGHTILFAEAGEEKFVPNIPEVIQVCAERGHALKKEESVPDEEEKKTIGRPRKGEN